MPSARRLATVAALMLAVCAGYLATNHWHWKEPVFLPMTALDAALPFVPAAMLVYVSHFVLLPLALLRVRDEAVFARLVGAVLSACALSNVVFLLWPTTFPRVAYSGVLFDLIAAVDTPANCFPSQHVALAFVAAWGLRKDGAWWARHALVWAGAIALSTVLVKQHYAADVAGGAVLAVLSWKLSARRAPQPLPEGEPA